MREVIFSSILIFDMAEKDLSLLPKKGEYSVIGKITTWVLTVGRFIVVFTELLVIGAFLSRFWLDQKNTDLSEAIRQEKMILESTAPFEKEFNLFQARTNEVDKKLDETFTPLLPLEKVLAVLPQDIILVKYEFTAGVKNEASFSTQVFSEGSLAQFTKSLLKEKEVASVKIGTIEKEEGVSGSMVQILIKFNLEEKKSGGNT